jgi:hypothetical protein
MKLPVGGFLFRYRLSPRGEGEWHASCGRLARDACRRLPPMPDSATFTGVASFCHAVRLQQPAGAAP